MSYGNSRDRNYNDRGYRAHHSSFYPTTDTGYSPYSRGHGRGGRGGRGHGRGGRGGGYRGRGRGGRGGSGRGGMKYRYSENISPNLLAQIEHTHTKMNDQRGPTPLYTYTSHTEQVKYEQSRWRPNYAARVDMKTGVRRLVQLDETIKGLDAQMDIDRWLSGMPKHNNKTGTLQFGTTIPNLISNSMPILTKSMNITQFTFNCKEANDPINSCMAPNDPIKSEIFLKSRRKLRPSLFIFDKMHLFSWGESAKEYAFDVRLRGKVYNVLITDPSESSIHSFQPAFRQTAFSIVNRTRFQKAGWNKMFRMDEIYFNLKDKKNMTYIKQSGDLKYPHLTLLKGYKSTLAYAANKQLIIKTAVHHKLITADPVSHYLNEYQPSDAERFLVGKNAITNYGHSRIKDKVMKDQMIKIDGIDWNMNLMSTFTKSDGTEITFYDYFVKDKGLVLRSQHEDAMIVNHRYKRGSREIESKNYYPPQLVHVLCRNEEISEYTKKLHRQRQHPTAQETCAEAAAVNRMINQTSKSKLGKLFETVLEPIPVTGYVLNAPFICFHGRNNNMVRHDLHTFGGRQWSEVKDLIYYGQQPNRKWIIYYDMNTRDGERNAQSMSRLFGQFMNKRQFKRPPLAKPDIEGVDYRDLGSVRGQVRNPKYCVSLFIVQNDMNGSKQKIQITKHALMRERQQSQPQQQHSYRPRTIPHDIGFILNSNCGNRNAAFGVFESMFLKAGLGLYTVDNNLPCRVFNVDSIWLFGVKIYKNKGFKLALVTCNMKPFDGALKWCVSLWFPLPKQVDVVPASLMKSFIQEIFNRCQKVMPGPLPTNLVFIRHSGGDSLFKEIVSKEVAAIKVQLRHVAKKYYPGVCFVVWQENVSDTFGVKHQNTVHMIKQAVLVTDGITSSDLLDTYLSVAVKQDGHEYTKVQRIILLADDYNNGKDARNKAKIKLRNDERLLSDFYQIIYGQFYLNAQNIPFVKKPCLPAPILLAQHAAGWVFELILNDDTIEDLQLCADLENAKPRLLGKGN
eukprot:205482_1